MKKSRKIIRTKGRRTKGRRTKGRRTRRMKMTGGTTPVTHTNIQQKIGYAKKARKEEKENADKLEEDIDDYITKHNLWKYKDWKYGNFKPVHTNPDGTKNPDWYFEKYNKETGTARIGW
jgi:hypothetical protein